MLAQQFRDLVELGRLLLPGLLAGVEDGQQMGLARLGMLGLIEGQLLEPPLGLRVMLLLMLDGGGGHELDVRVQRPFRIGRATLTAGIDIYNIPGMKKEVDEYVVAGPRFRKTTAIQPPRTGLVSVRLVY